MTRCVAGVAAIVAAAAVAAAATGCATSSFDRHFDARRWEDAASAFAADSALRDSDRALYRAAIVYATPATDAYDPDRARELLERLIERAPRGPRTVEATALLSLLYEIERQQNERVTLERETGRRIAALAAEIAALRQELERVEQRYTENQAEAEQLRSLAASLRAALRERESRLRALQQELDRLKEIDLNAPQRVPPGGSGRNGA